MMPLDIIKGMMPLDRFEKRAGSILQRTFPRVAALVRVVHIDCPFTASFLLSEPPPGMLASTRTVHAAEGSFAWDENADRENTSCMQQVPTEARSCDIN